MVASTLLHLPIGVSRAVVVADTGGHLLVLGGLTPGDSTTARVWSIDTTSRSVRPAGHLAVAVHDASGAVLGGHAFVFGGGSATSVATVQEYDGGHARVVGALPEARSDSAAAVIGSTAYVVGGFDGHAMDRDVLATMDGRHFRVVAKLRIGVRYPAVAVMADRFLVVAGGALATTEGTANGAQTSAVQRVDVQTGRVDVVGQLATAMAHATGVTLQGLPLVIGGRRGAQAVRGIASVLLPSAVRSVGSLPQGLSDSGVAVVGNAAYVVGGETTGPGAPTSAVLVLHLNE